MSLDAVSGYSVRMNNLQKMSYPQKANLSSAQSFTSKTEVDEEKSNAAKYMVGATALAAVIGLGIAGYKGMLGKSVREFLGGAEKAVEKGGQNASESAGSASKPLTEGAEHAGNKAGDTLTGVTEKEVGSADNALVDAAEVTVEKTASNAADVTKGANTNISDEINKCNEYFKKYNPNYEAFVDRNNPEQIIIMNKTKGSGYDKQIFSIKDFKVDSNGAPPQCRESISSAIASSFNSIEKIAPNGTKTKIVRKNLPDGGKSVVTDVSDGLGSFYYKNVIYDKNGNILKTSEVVSSFDGVIQAGEEGFETAKKSVLADLREGLNWQE